MGRSARTRTTHPSSRSNAINVTATTPTTTSRGSSARSRPWGRRTDWGWNTKSISAFDPEHPHRMTMNNLPNWPFVDFLFCFVICRGINHCFGGYMIYDLQFIIYIYLHICPCAICRFDLIWSDCNPIPVPQTRCVWDSRYQSISKWSNCRGTGRETRSEREQELAHGPETSVIGMAL